jgi:hypothetical protein
VKCVFCSLPSHPAVMQLTSGFFRFALNFWTICWHCVGGRNNRSRAYSWSGTPNWEAGELIGPWAKPVAGWNKFQLLLDAPANRI